MLRVRRENVLEGKMANSRVLFGKKKEQKEERSKKKETEEDGGDKARRAETEG